MDFMPSSPISAQSEPAIRPRVELPSIFQFGLSLIAVLGLWGMALSVLLIGMWQLSNTPALGLQAAPAFLWAVNMLVMGLLVMPSAYYALRYLIKPVQLPAMGAVSGRIFWGFSLVLAVVFPLDVWLGYSIINSETWVWLILPVLHLLAVGIPIIWLYLLGSRGLSVGTPQRFWGILSCGLTLGPAIILILEIGAILVFVILGGIFISTRPDLVEKLTSLAQRLSHVPNLVVAERILVPILKKPLVLQALLIYGAILVPAMEELIKPVGLWLLVRRGLTPAQGFAGGLLSGAAYVVFESLSLVNASSAWAMLVLVRVGTALLHIVTTGIMGWALVQVWPAGPGKGKHGWMRLVFTYLGVVCLHGLWNGLTLVNAWVELLNRFEASPSHLLVQTGKLAPFGLGVLVLVLMTLLVVVNQRVRMKTQISSG